MLVLTLCNLHITKGVQRSRITPLPFEKSWSSRKILQVADSGFARRRYQEAFHHYNFLLQDRGVFSPQMLLKMSAYCESTQQFTQALYYLNLYYLHNPGTEVRQKIEDISTVNNLSGYTFSELDYFLFLYNQYFIYICSFHVFMAFVFLAVMLYRKFKQKPLVYNPLFFIGFLLAAGFTANFGLLYRRGIVSNDQSILMSGPSNGADYNGRIDQGHKLVITDRNDIWYKVEWQGQAQWINKKNILLIEN